MLTSFDNVAIYCINKDLYIQHIECHKPTSSMTIKNIINTSSRKNVDIYNTINQAIAYSTKRESKNISVGRNQILVNDNLPYSRKFYKKSFLL